MPAGAGIPCPTDNVVVARFLRLDHAREELGMVGEVGVHDDEAVCP